MASTRLCNTYTFSQVANPPLEGTQLAPAVLSASGAPGQNFTAVANSSVARTPAFFTPPGSDTSLNLLLQDTQVGTGSSYCLRSSGHSHISQTETALLDTFDLLSPFPAGSDNIL